MSALQERQRQMMRYLLGQSDDIAEHVVDQGNISRDIRLAIYKNAYQIRLKETIETDHEILGFYLGDDMFDPMVAAYIAAYPSQKRSLRQYADNLPRFLSEEYKPFAEYPQIGEIARFERLLLSAFDAGDAERFSREDLAEIAPDDWPAMQFRFHPSTQLFFSQWNVVEIWQALKGQEAPPEPLQDNHYWLLWRNDERLTEFRSIQTMEYELFQLALAGENFAALCETLLEQVSEEEAGQVAVGYLLQWIDQGLLLK